MSFFPSSLLEKLYTRESLENTETGFQFKIKNRLSSAKLTEVISAKVGEHPITPSEATLDFGGGNIIKADQIEGEIEFALGQEFTVSVEKAPLSSGDYNVAIAFVAKPFGKLSIKVSDSIA